ncbi:TetR/AcrR family transcriptional regulator [Gallaecimonas mangrovi]|uniref:TetR/AcrR family transcriptional regulator n=1 Tax=Gallaecimonas mangrovi TaxID=2291597 RepID=UPI000E20242C|nr:TetR/AcrR family transcriptional regulator [Gallaecimonas mangrovi]
MKTSNDRRTRKRLATRQAIATAATALFKAKGFDNVTVDEIAQAADVGRMTVFNHFSRKEDIFFDRYKDAQELLQEAFLQRQPSVPALEVLHRLVHRLIEEKVPYLTFSPESQAFVATVEASDSLKARARAIRDELVDTVARALAGCVALDKADADARLAAGLILAAWSTALRQAHGTYRQHHDEKAAEADFVAIIDKGHIAVTAAMAGTPYV